MAQILMSDEARRQLGIGVDAGIYDAIQDTWYMVPEGVDFYRPDLRPPVPGHLDDD
jgi:hypothetical protein